MLIIFVPQIAIAIYSGIFAGIFTGVAWKYSTYIPSGGLPNVKYDKVLLKMIVFGVIGAFLIAICIASGLYYFQMYFPKIMVMP